MLVGLLSSPHASAIGTHNADVTPESAYTEFAEQFPEVGFLFGFEGETAATFSSGVLIHPNFALTSGHGILINDGDSTSTYDSYLFGLGANSSSEATEFQSVDAVFLAPDYAGVENGVDLALLYFEDPFTSVFPARVYDEQIRIGEVTSIVGFGDTGTPATGLQLPSDGIKRAAQSVISEEGSTNGGYAEFRFRNQHHPDSLSLGGQGLPGDSGGGWFIESEGEHWLFGISSSGESSPRYGADTAAFEIRLAADWINETIASVTQPFAGDYDGNGVVEAADYQVWAQSLGEFGVALPADGNLDGVVDAADYALWRDALATPATVAVPAPSTGLLLVIALVGGRRRVAAGSVEDDAHRLSKRTAPR